MDEIQIFELATWVTWWKEFASSPSNVVAAAAVMVSVVSAWSTSKHGRLSVMPAFSTWAEYPSVASSNCTMTFSNKGFGPAIIDSMELWNGDKRGEGQLYRLIGNVIREAFDGHVKDGGQWARFGTGHAERFSRPEPNCSAFP